MWDFVFLGCREAKLTFLQEMTSKTEIPKIQPGRGAHVKFYTTVGKNFKNTFSPPHPREMIALLKYDSQ